MSINLSKYVVPQGYMEQVKAMATELEESLVRVGLDQVQILKGLKETFRQVSAKILRTPQNQITETMRVEYMAVRLLLAKYLDMALKADKAAAQEGAAPEGRWQLWLNNQKVGQPLSWWKALHWYAVLLRSLGKVYQVDLCPAGYDNSPSSRPF